VISSSGPSGSSHQDPAAVLAPADVLPLAALLFMGLGGIVVIGVFVLWLIFNLL